MLFHLATELLFLLDTARLPFGSDLPEHFPSLTATLLLVSNLLALFRWQFWATLFFRPQGIGLPLDFNLASHRSVAARKRQPKQRIVERIIDSSARPGSRAAFAKIASRYSVSENSMSAASESGPPAALSLSPGVRLHLREKGDQQGDCL